ncbi:MAG TPA: thioredoxin-dependent thiol peroxidase [Deltaproteobacteria bacterium]|nr:thioredoxin-dependent thiol peroxidase [Deltaproteobacteria bacterium]HCP48440.1 thioredoxin-dependent thiol peroxidase [Deltaproteobacteria bacterium]
MATTLQPGDPAPDFQLESDDGGTVSLESLKGKKVVLYFYPKDNTPGCTAQACEFRDQLNVFEENNAVILGVSRDSLASHSRFRQKFDLNFPLLTDPEAAVHRAYGAWGEKTMYGKTTEGVLRTTVIIDEEGRIVSQKQRVRAKGNAERTLGLMA